MTSRKTYRSGLFFIFFESVYWLWLVAFTDTYIRVAKQAYCDRNMAHCDRSMAL